MFTQICLHLYDRFSPELIVCVDSFWWLVQWDCEQPALVKVSIDRGLETLYLHHSMIHIALQSVFAKMWFGKWGKYQWQPQVHEQAACVGFAVGGSLYRSEIKGHSAWEDCLCSMCFTLQPAGAGSLLLPPVYPCCSTGTETPHPNKVQKIRLKLWSSNKTDEGHHWCQRLMEQQDEFVRQSCQEKCVKCTTNLSN